MTDSEKISDIQKKITRIHYMQAIVATVVVLGFVGIFSLAQLTNKLKK